jgi:hypothetical protein
MNTREYFRSFPGVGNKTLVNRVLTGEEQFKVLITEGGICRNLLTTIVTMVLTVADFYDAWLGQEPASPGPSAAALLVPKLLARR